MTIRCLRTSALAVPLLIGLPGVPRDTKPEAEAVPPRMSIRSIAPSAEGPSGETVELVDAGIRFALFIPERWEASASGTETLCVHFHTAPWFTIQEHERCGATMPLVVFALGEGSAVYAQAFRETDRFGRVLTWVAAELRRRGAHLSARIAAVDVSSFSGRCLAGSGGQFRRRR